MGGVFREQREKVRLEPSAEVKGAAREHGGSKKPILRHGEKGCLLEEGVGVHQGCRASWSLLGLGWRHSWGSRFWASEKPGVGGAVGRVQHCGWRGWPHLPLGHALWVPGPWVPAPRHWPPLLLQPASQEHPPRLRASFGQGGRCVESSTRCHSPAVTSSCDQVLGHEQGIGSQELKLKES